MGVIKMGERVPKKRKERYVTRRMFAKVMGISDFVSSLSKLATQYSRLMSAYPSPLAQSSSCRGKEDEGGPFCIKRSSCYSRTNGDWFHDLGS